ncbi:MAG: hemerythrin domain-containing protein [Elusimicrobia bacterium]|nr:hemerythrin domain-containing protein [Elusimicrobiota bacterium]
MPNGTENKTESALSEFFARDHGALDGLLECVDFADAERALPALGEFHRRLERHIVWEEDVLFPAVRRAAPGFIDGPIEVMRREHREIRARKAEALELLRGGDGAGARERIGVMRSIMNEHTVKEERVLYPFCDRLLADAEAERILRLLESSPA